MFAYLCVISVGMCLFACASGQLVDHFKRSIKTNLAFYFSSYRGLKSRWKKVEHIGYPKRSSFRAKLDITHKLHPLASHLIQRNGHFIQRKTLLITSIASLYVTFGNHPNLSQGTRTDLALKSPRVSYVDTGNTDGGCVPLSPFIPENGAFPAASPFKTYSAILAAALWRTRWTCLWPGDGGDWGGQVTFLESMLHVLVIQL